MGVKKAITPACTIATEGKEKAIALARTGRFRPLGPVGITNPQLVGGLRGPSSHRTMAIGTKAPAAMSTMAHCFGKFSWVTRTSATTAEAQKPANPAN
jgi:hypothetical protein